MPKQQGSVFSFMLLFILAFLGGMLTIFSPCVLPVVPFVFAQAGRSFRTNGLPTLVGMAITFALVSSGAAIGGGWVVRANQVGRVAALVLLAALGLALVWPAFGERLMRPFVALGAAVQRRGEARAGVGGALLVGVAIGFLWAPCAGPVLGLILTTAALGGPTVRTTLLLLAFGAGAAVSLGVAIMAGSRLLGAMKRGLGAEAWIRRGLGVAVLAGVAAVGMGWDTGILARVALASPTSAEQRLVDRLARGPSVVPSATSAASDTLSPAAGSPPIAADRLPDLSRATGWLNTRPLTAAELHGHVVLLDVWTYSCINCIRTLPYVEAWASQYRADGLVVIGVHSPEFAFERDPSNVARAVRDLGVTYPVALDNGYGIWRALGNQYWPAEYLIDTSGHIRYRNAGEGHEAETERQIRVLLGEAGRSMGLGVPVTSVDARGAEAPATGSVGSPETYVGYRRAERLASPEPVLRDTPQNYSAPPTLSRNSWALAGRWTVGPEAATLDAAPGRILFRFHARDLHLVLGLAPNGRPVRFRIRIDGAPPMGDHGTDTDFEGNGTITGERLYQLVRQHDAIVDHTLEIEFLDAGATVYAFTFG